MSFEQTNSLPVKVAVVQAASVFLDRDASIQKMIRLATEAADNDAQLVLFPEAFIAGYPRGFSFGATVGNRSREGRALFRRYADSAVTGPGPDTLLLSETAEDLGIHLAVGLVEKDAAHPGTLYCSLAIFDNHGELLNLHRKIKPTASERLIWGEGDGSGLRTSPTPYGRLGGLICWENYMPLARTTLYSQGIEIYLAPTADARESWQSTMRHIALEGRCFVLSANQFVTKADYPTDLGKEAMRELELADDPLCRGGSAIIGPLGDYLAGPLWDEEGILYATLDPADITEARFDFDVVGHYSRPDLFQLSTKPQVGMSALDDLMLDSLLGDALVGGPFGLLPPFGGEEGLFPEEDADDLFAESLPVSWRDRTPAFKTSNKPKKPRKPRR
jgi:nitrilase